VVDASRNWQSFSSTHGVDLNSLTSGTLPEMDMLIMMDPPKHDRLRALVSRAFTPRAINGLEPMIRDVIVGYLDAIGDRPGFDAVADFTGPFPVDVISRMLGVPEPDRQQIRHWLDIMLTREEGEMHFGEAAEQAGIAMGTYFYELAATRRADPTDDMISNLIRAEVEGEDGEMTKLDDVEIAGFLGLIGGAGAETVTKLVANAVVLFDRHRDQRADVFGDPALLPGAVEEILRYLPPSQYQGRWSMTDVELHGEVIPAGEPVILLTGAATRDERQFDDPDRFDIRREPNLSMGLGHGIHSCLGAALARMESRIAIEEFGRRYPDYSVDEDGLERVQMANVAGYSKVPVTAACPTTSSSAAARWSTGPARPPAPPTWPCPTA
jgi:cytochrome P450